VKGEESGMAAGVQLDAASQLALPAADQVQSAAWARVGREARAAA
jgi:hypothetical protein